MLRVIIDNPHTYYPKFPRVIEGETEEAVERKVRRCLRGLKGQYSPAAYAETTVTLVVGTRNVGTQYGLGEAADG